MKNKLTADGIFRNILSLRETLKYSQPTITLHYECEEDELREIFEMLNQFDYPVTQESRANIIRFQYLKVQVIISQLIPS